MQLYIKDSEAFSVREAHSLLASVLSVMHPTRTPTLTETEVSLLPRF